MTDPLLWLWQTFVVLGSFMLVMGGIAAVGVLILLLTSNPMELKRSFQRWRRQRRNHKPTSMS